MQQMYNCPRCGQPVAQGMRFCETCGTQLTWPSQSQQQPYQQQSQPPQQPYQQQYQQSPQQNYEPPKKKKRGWLIALASVVGLVVIIFIVAVASGSSETDTSPSLSETDTPAQTTSSESEYLGKLNKNSTAVGDALIKLGDQMQNYEPDSDEWIIKTAAQIVIVQSAYEEAKEFNPPASMDEIHDKYIEALSHFDQATRLLTEAIDNVDVTSLEQSMEELEAGNVLILEATEMINNFK